MFIPSSNDLAIQTLLNCQFLYLSWPQQPPSQKTVDQWRCQVAFQTILVVNILTNLRLMVQQKQGFAASPKWLKKLQFQLPEEVLPKHLWDSRHCGFLQWIPMRCNKVRRKVRCNWHPKWVSFAGKQGSASQVYNPNPLLVSLVFSNFLDPPVTFCDPLCGATMLKSQNLPSTLMWIPAPGNAGNNTTGNTWQYLPQYLTRIQHNWQPITPLQREQLLAIPDGYTSITP